MGFRVVPAIPVYRTIPIWQGDIPTENVTNAGLANRIYLVPVWLAKASSVIGVGLGPGNPLTAQYAFCSYSVTGALQGEQLVNPIGVVTADLGFSIATTTPWTIPGGRNYVGLQCSNATDRLNGWATSTSDHVPPGLWYSIDPGSFTRPAQTTPVVVPETGFGAVFPFNFQFHMEG